MCIPFQVLQHFWHWRDPDLPCPPPLLLSLPLLASICSFHSCGCFILSASFSSSQHLTTPPPVRIKILFLFIYSTAVSVVSGSLQCNLQGNVIHREFLKLQILVVTNVHTFSKTETFLDPWVGLKMAGLGLCSGWPQEEWSLMVLGIYTRPFKGIEQFWVFKTLALEKETELFSGKSSKLGVQKRKFEFRLCRE